MKTEALYIMPEKLFGQIVGRKLTSTPCSSFPTFLLLTTELSWYKSC